MHIPNLYTKSITYHKTEKVTLPWALLNDPGWFYHMFNLPGFKEGKFGGEDLIELCRRAQSIRIPSAQENREQQVEYIFGSRTYMSLSAVNIVPAGAPAFKGKGSCRRRPHINLLFQAQTKRKGHDKSELILDRDKDIYFLTIETGLGVSRVAAAEFFGNPEHFAS